MASWAHTRALNFLERIENTQKIVPVANKLYALCYATLGRTKCFFFSHIESFLHYRSYGNIRSVKSVAHMNKFFWRLNQIVSTKSCIRSTSALKPFIRLIGQFSPPLIITLKFLCLKILKITLCSAFCKTSVRYMIVINGSLILDRNREG